MSVKQNMAAARRLFEDVISRGQFDRAGDLIAATCVDHNPGPGQGPGREGVVDFFRQIRVAFPDWHVSIEDLVAQSDRVVARLVADVTHGGTFLGIPPTGRRVRIRVIDILRFERGRVVERWGERNDAEILQQLGHVPGPIGEATTTGVAR